MLIGGQNQRTKREHNAQTGNGMATNGNKTRDTSSNNVLRVRLGRGRSGSVILIVIGSSADFPSLGAEIFPKVLFTREIP